MRVALDFATSLCLEHGTVSYGALLKSEQRNLGICGAVGPCEAPLGFLLFSALRSILADGFAAPSRL